MPTTEWNNKPVTFVGYGGVGGARAIEQLRLMAVELQMAPIRAGVHIQWAVYEPVAKGEKKLEDFGFLNDTAKGMLDQLAWWANALNAARAKDEQERRPPNRAFSHPAGAWRVSCRRACHPCRPPRNASRDRRSSRP
jgi:NAD(P)H-dependent FMN reductase